MAVSGSAVGSWMSCPSSAMAESVFDVILCALSILHLEKDVCVLPTAAEKELGYLSCLTVTKPGEGSHRLE